MKYCCVDKPRKMSLSRRDSKFNERGIIAESLGVKIMKAVEFGADIGTPAIVQYDEEGQKGVNVMTSPDHDFFDIAEQFANADMPTVGAPIQVASVDDETVVAPMHPNPVGE